MSYLGALLLAMAAGLWPDTLFIQPSGGAHLIPPTLQCAAVATTIYFLLVWPVLTLRRQQRHGPMRFGKIVLESLGLIAVGLPVLLAAAFLADASVQDVGRTLGMLAVLLPTAWGVSLVLGRFPRLRGAIVAAMLGAVLGLPAMTYVTMEFLHSSAEGPAGVIWSAGPAMLTWRVSASRIAAWLPGPGWACFAWLAVGGGLLAVAMTREQDTSSA